MIEDEIQSLSGLEAIRLRPGMYVQSDDSGSVSDHLIRAALCQPLAELAGCSASQVSVHVHGKSVTITDDGHGWPVHMLPGGGRAAEAMLSRLYACLDHKEDEDIAHSLCRITLQVVVALSVEFIFHTHRHGECWTQTYRHGVADAPLACAGSSQGSGTKMAFILDPQFCGDAGCSRSSFSAWLATLPPHIPVASITFEDS